MKRRLANAALSGLATLSAVTFATLAVSASAYAIDGCVDSPENPTLLLGLLGGAAAGVPWLRARFKRRGRG